jgi:glycosyltransferase involved in cell wall biosynthesis
LRIALLIPWFLPNRGGAEIGAWELVRQLARRHDVHVISPRYKSDWPAEETIEGVHVHRYFSRFPSALRRMGEVAHCLQAVPGVSRLLDKIRPDVIHLQYLFFTGYAGMRWAKANDVPVVLTLIGNDVYDPYYIPCEFLSPLNRWMVQQADVLTVTSRFVGDVVAQKFGPLRQVPQLIPYGVDFSSFRTAAAAEKRALRASLALPAEGPVIVTVQRLHERKGVDVFLRAAAEVLKTAKDATFVVVGDGPERERLVTLARQLRIKERVRFAGRVTHEDGLARYYQAADLFAFHTYHEGFGIVLLESMASGLPVVTTRAGGTLDVVPSTEYGLVVEPGRADEFAAAILQLLAKPGDLEAMGARNRTRVEREFSWELHAERYEAIYGQLLHAGQRRTAVTA